MADAVEAQVKQFIALVDGGKLDDAKKLLGQLKVYSRPSIVSPLPLFLRHRTHTVAPGRRPFRSRSQDSLPLALVALPPLQMLRKSSL